ncbi:MAG: aminoacetone oxidase family FAD-binding enzyme [Prevotella sp.]|nr:aminoacetone oxidase family FAD-binding enzyme [Prevotella sp.]
MIAVVGGGAAGFFAAIRAKEVSPQTDVVIFEKGAKPLAKVAVTGGGRCNLTNSFAGVADLRSVYPRGHNLMKRLFKTFDYRDTFQWFEDRGVPLVTQSDCCVFPQSQSSQSIIDCLLRESLRLGVKVKPHHALAGITPADGSLILHFEGPQPDAVARGVIITTGGHSRQSSFDYLRRLGHEIVPPVPSLFTFNIADQAFRDLMGTVVEQAQMTVVGERMRSEGPLLVTHWGMSGPCVLRLSSYAARWASERQYHFRVAVNWVGETDCSSVVQSLTSLSAQYAARQLDNVHPFGLPSRLWAYLLQKSGQPPQRRWGELGRKGINRLMELLTNDVYAVEGKSRWRDEFVTCGGVSLSSISSATLQSKHVPGLFFAGEVTDVDAVTGGFNLQAAWTMGYVAGEQCASQITK